MERGTGEWSIEVARSPEGALADDVVGLWTSTGALPEPAARARLPEVVCVVRDPAGAVAGVSSAFAADVDLVGGVRYWVYRSFGLAAAEHLRDALVARTFAALEAEYEPRAGAPVGLCLLLDRAAAARRPEARWADPPLAHAGFLDDGRQVRVCCFARACVADG